MYHFLYRLKWLVVANSIFVPKIVAVIYFVTFGERPAGPKGLEMFIMVFKDHNLFLGDLLPVLCYRKKIACGCFFFVRGSCDVYQCESWLFCWFYFFVRKKRLIVPGVGYGWELLDLSMLFCVVYLFQFIVLTKF